MSEGSTILVQASAVAIDGRALMIEGPPGSGKSSLALSLIDRGAKLVGDDGVTLARKGASLLASPPPNIAGCLEVRGVGIARFPETSDIPLALILVLGQQGERLPQSLARREILGIAIPVLPFDPGSIAPAIRAEIALAVHGLEHS